jgi:ribose 5-phosphate isomerase B
MKVLIASDHRGFEMKGQLQTLGYDIGESLEWVDLGPELYDSTDDYPDYAINMVDNLQSHPEAEHGVLLCGSGVGMNIVANKFIGVRATIGLNPEHVKVARNDEDINVLIIAAEFTNIIQARIMVEEFLKTPYSNMPADQRRLDKIKDLEHSDIVEE